MKHHTYTPDGIICATEIAFDLDGDVVRNLRFTDGCSGNAQAIGKLCEGRRVEEVIGLLKGIDCDGRGTSCADQLTQALESAVNSPDRPG